MTAAAMVGAGEKGVAVLLAGRSERLVLDAAGLLAQEFPRVGGAAFDRAVQLLRSRFPVQIAGALLNDFVLLLSEMNHSARLPRLRSGRTRSANKDEVFFIAMLAALQRADKGRAIEAAIAMLDTGRVNGVILSAQGLARRLSDAGVLLSGIRAEIFDLAAGYPVVARSGDAAVEAPPPASRPTLRLLQSA
jgi:hypothetical protein